MPTPKYEKRSTIYLKIGSSAVMPMMLILHDPQIFQEKEMQEIMSFLKQTLPSLLGNFESSFTIPTKDVEIPQPSIYKSSSLCFSYHVRRGTVPGCVLTTSNLKIENKKEEKENEKDSNKSKKKSKKRSREEDEVKNNENLDNDDDIQLISEKKRKTETFDLESEQSNASTMSTNINDTTTQSYVLENNYVGGKYLGFTITKYVLVVETLSKENASKQTTGIAQYFAVPTSTSSHTNNNNNNNNNSTSNSSNKPIEAEKPKRKNAKHNYLRK